MYLHEAWVSFVLFLRFVGCSFDDMTACFDGAFGIILVIAIPPTQIYLSSHE